MLSSRFSLPEPSYYNCKDALSESEMFEDRLRILSWLVIARKDDDKDLTYALSCFSFAWQAAFINEEIIKQGGCASEVLQRKMEKFLAEDPFLGLADIDHLSKKFFTALASCRKPWAWIVYTDALRRCYDERVRSCWSYVLRSIVEGTFAQSRYRAAEGCAHIQKIRQEFDSTWQQWQEKKEIVDLPKKISATDLNQACILADTDDWQDMLLCGTEVAGCCQRVDGTPALNRCLLAYLIDGKNRMIAIKGDCSLA